MKKYEMPNPREIPSTYASFPLDPVDLGGLKYYGWEFVPTTKFDTGKKDPHTKKEMFGDKIDTTKKPIYDTVTTLLKAGKLQDPTIAKMVVQNAQNSAMIAKLINQVVSLQLKVQGGNK